MKVLLPTLLIAVGLAASAQAAMTAGFSAGYLVDNQEEYLAARLGNLFKTTDAASHIAELEIGFSSMSASEEGISGSLDVLPVMANYRREIASTSKYGGYVGAGLGMSRVKISGSGMGVSFSENDWAFTAQAFAGFTYAMTDTSSFTIGARYINIGDVEFFGEDFGEVGDDIAIEVGFHFRL